VDLREIGLFEIQVFGRRKRRRQKEDYLATQASISQDGALGLRFLWPASRFSEREIGRKRSQSPRDRSSANAFFSGCCWCSCRCVCFSLLLLLLYHSSWCVFFVNSPFLIYQHSSVFPLIVSFLIVFLQPWIVKKIIPEIVMLKP